jgi:hypothetical protein
MYELLVIEVFTLKEMAFPAAVPGGATTLPL